MARTSLFIYGCVCLFTACGQTPSPGTISTNNAAPDQPTNTSVQQKANVMKFIKHEVVDRQGTGLVASTYLLPEGWTAQDQLYWEYNDATVPIRYKGLFTSPDGNFLIQSYPDVRSVWSSGPSGTSGYPAPAGLIAGLREVIKAERKGLAFRVSEEKLVNNTPPHTTYQVGTPIVSSSQAGFIRIEFQHNGKTFEEEFYGQLDVSEMRMPSAYGEMRSIIWAGSSLYSCRAPKGKLEDCRKIAMTAKSSAQLNLQFYNRLTQIIQKLSDQVYANIYRAGQVSRIISETNDQMLESIRSSYNQSQQAYQRTHNQFSDYMRGVENYGDGQSQVKLPSGYSNAWVNDKGEYLLSSTQGYDPNTQLNGNWKALQKQ